MQIHDNSQRKSIILQRNCDALLVPSGEEVHLEMGTEISIYQQLGGNFTVLINNNLARISGEDADALGYEVKALSSHDSVALSESDVFAKLKECYDPEIPVNIVDLGLIYKCEVIFDKNSEVGMVNILMTLTAPGCAMGPVLVDDIKKSINRFSNVKETNVEVTFDPPWSMESISEVGKLQLGLL